MSIPPFATGVLWLALILGVTAGFFVAARKLRERRGGNGEPVSANQLLAEFRELHDNGELSDEEFKTIRLKLVPQLQEEANSAAAGATTMAEAAASLRGSAELLTGGWAGRGDLTGRSDQRDPSDAAGRDAHDGCDAAPPDGGDSTEDVR